MSAPPVGYRPSISNSLKFNVVLRQGGRCTRCGEKLTEWSDTQFDHDPAIQLRAWSEELQDTLPAANDALHIKALHKDCHKVKTTGRQGESALSKRGGDISEVAKVRRISKKTEEFRRKLLTKGDPEPDSTDVPRRKKAWPSRPWPKRRKASPHEPKGE